jgi:hypothetical protein
MKNIFYNKYIYKWQNILTITHFAFLIIFIASLVLMGLHDLWLSSRLFIVAILIGVVLSVFKMVGVKKKDIIEVKNQKS